MPWFDHEGCSLHYAEYGHGIPLILIHGLGSSSQDWELQIPVLARHYRLIVVDVRGHGRSDKPRERYSIAGFSADLIALARTVRDGVRNAFGVTLVPEPVLVGVTLD